MTFVLFFILYSHFLAAHALTCIINTFIIIKTVTNLSLISPYNIMSFVLAIFDTSPTKVFEFARLLVLTAPKADITLI